MLYSKKTDYLMESIRLGREMDRREKLNLIVGLSIPSMLAQISTVMMFFIDASMVGHLGAEASASIGLIESTTWLIGSLLSAAATGFSVQVAHFIGANECPSGVSPCTGLRCGVQRFCFSSLCRHSFLSALLVGWRCRYCHQFLSLFSDIRSGAAIRFPLSYIRDDAEIGGQYAYA